MMLEQSLINPNFLGKESFRWFIGITTKYIELNPKTGTYKAKVRIIGYHPDLTNIVKDEELPWAHVLVPLSLGTGIGGNACTANSKGGEYVIGFFADGDNGQQPIIIGALYGGGGPEHPNDFSEGTNKFRPFKPDVSKIKNPNNRSSETGKPFNQSKSGVATPGGANPNKPTEPTQGNVATNTGGLGNTFCLAVPPVCDDSSTTYSRILRALRNFIKALRTVQQVQSEFINPTLNQIQDIPGLVQDVAISISDLISKYMKKKRDNIIKDIQKWLKDQMDKLFSKEVKLLKQIFTEKLVDEIWCIFSRIIKSINKFIFDFLTQLVGAVTSIPLCAAEAFVGSIMSTLNNDVSNALKPVLEEITSNIGPVLGEISNYTSLALSYANQALSFSSCESAECKQSLDYEMNKGFIKKESIDWYQNALNYPNTSIAEGKKAAEQWLGITGGENSDSEYSYLSATYGYCDAINLDCGLPIIEFFSPGGGGSGATGLAVVDALGQIMGINIQNSGTGYSTPPYVSVQDPCNNGSGAVATANVTDGQVTSVTIVSPGSGYLGPSSITTPCTTNPVDQSGSDVIGYIVGVNILNTGVGYASTDLITDIACNSDVQIYPTVDQDGRIIGTKIVNPGSAIRVFPELAINTQDGEGAILQPILNFKPVEPVSVETNMNKINKVVLCAEDHGG
jgi:hypothetical protein